MKTWIIVVGAVLSLVFGRDPSAAPPAVIIDRQLPGPTPFISLLQVKIREAAKLSYIQFTVHPKQGSQTRALSARYSSAYLQRRGYLNLGTGIAKVPVFGLYANFHNIVTLESGFVGGTSQWNKVKITTMAFDGGTYTNPTIVQPRLQNTTLSYDYIFLKSYGLPNTPIIVDSDAEVRWVGTAGISSQASILFDNSIYVGSGSALVRMEFDGTYRTEADYSSLGVVGFHHNFDYGRNGFIMEVDTDAWTECVNLEVDSRGNVLKIWNLADIISAAMVAGGDDPNLFVQPAPADWFHNNATAYRRSDDSLIVSSRENFVIAIDYDTNAIKWILGDATKYWYQFSSLRAFALTLGPDTLPPIGQHALSVATDQLLLFDNGVNSLYQMPPGENRTYSAPRRYYLDAGGNGATEVWHYLADPPIYSPFCSSVYEDAPDNYLIDYALAGPYVSTEIVGLDSTGRKAFDYQYLEIDFCGTAWNAVPIHLENLSFK